MEAVEALQGMDGANSMGTMEMMSPEMINALAIGNQVGGVFQPLYMVI